jgi:hypothetical protein
MSKKNFRAVSHQRPRYPKPSELTQSSLGKLGLAALGGILLGGTPQAHAEESKEAEAAKPVRSKSGPSGAKKGKPDKTVGTDAPEPRFMPNGGKPAPRIVEVGEPAPNSASHGGQGSGTATSTSTSVTPPERFPLAGKPMTPRMREEEKVHPKKPAKTSGSQKANSTTSTKTDTDTASGTQLPRLGAPRRARLVDEEGTPSPGEIVGTAVKTDTKTEPVVMPPPGVPPLPRKPEPPAPKKSK